MNDSSPTQEFALHSILVRKPVEDDIPFVMSSWLKSYSVSDFAKPIPRKIFFAKHHNLVESLFQRGAQIAIASLQEDTNVILGWICDESRILHYIYTKKPFRRLGICKTLIGDKKYDIFTHMTYATKFLTTLLHGAQFNPYI